MARKALVVGIDYYEHFKGLTGCVRDAEGVGAKLKRNEDESANFDVRLLVSADRNQVVRRRDLKTAAEELFGSREDVALFYFAGHGHAETTGGYLCTSEVEDPDSGLPLSDIMKMALESPSKNKIIILDSCHSGAAGDSASNANLSAISVGTTILTASGRDQTAGEGQAGAGGIFTNLLVDALSGGAADLLGNVTPGSIYAHIDQSLGRWGQRPVFKTNVQNFVSLRQVKPPIELSALRQLPSLFPHIGYRIQLDPSFEPEITKPGPNPKADLENTKVFSVLQKFNRQGLLKPVSQPHMYHAAINSDQVELTPLGEHYRHLAARGAF